METKFPTIKCSHYPCSSCRKFVKWNKEQMYLFHFPETIYNNHQFLFLCEYCLFQTFIYIQSSMYNFFAIDDFMKAIITNDNNFIVKSFKTDNLLIESYPNSDFPSYSSFFFYFLTWYEQNQITQHIIKFLIETIGIPFKCSDFFIDRLILESDMNIDEKSYLLTMRNLRLRENYELAKLDLFFPEEIVELILSF